MNIPRDSVLFAWTSRSSEIDIQANWVGDILVAGNETFDKSERLRSMSIILNLISGGQRTGGYSSLKSLGLRTLP